MAVESALHQGSFVAYPLVLLGGLIAGLNPCCVALYPVAAGTCCGVATDKLQHTFRRAVAFTMGTATATSLLGLLAAIAGRTMRSFGAWPFVLVALIPIAMGLHLLGVLRLRFASGISALHRVGGAFAIGFLAALLLAPCGTPILAAILAYVAYVGSAIGGAILLFVYGAGLSAPLLVAGTVGGAAVSRVQRIGGAWIERSAGVTLVAFGLYLIWLA